jgi:hypothetical protein
MSLLREAQACLKHQSLQSSLNAFVSLAKQDQVLTAIAAAETAQSSNGSQSD